MRRLTSIFLALLLAGLLCLRANSSASWRKAGMEVELSTSSSQVTGAPACGGAVRRGAV